MTLSEISQMDSVLAAPTAVQAGVNGSPRFRENVEFLARHFGHRRGISRSVCQIAVGDRLMGRSPTLLVL